MKTVIVKKNTLKALDVVTGEMTRKRKEFVQVDVDSAFKAFKLGKGVYASSVKAEAKFGVIGFEMKSIFKFYSEKLDSKIVQDYAAFKTYVGRYVSDEKDTKYKYGTVRFYI